MRQFAFCTLIRRGNVRAGHSVDTEGSKGEDPETCGTCWRRRGRDRHGGRTAVPASAANNIKPFGQQETLNDYGTGAPMIGYTVMGLSPSSDAVPHNGRLYAATVTVEGLGGWATPLIPLFNARAESGQNYRVIGGGMPRRRRGQTPARSTSTSWATRPTASSTTTGSRICWFGSHRGGRYRSGAPEVAGESTEIIGGAPTEGGGEVASAPAEAPAPPRSSRRPPSSSPNRRWLSQGSMQFPAGIADCSVTYGRSRNRREPSDGSR